MGGKIDHFSKSPKKKKITKDPNGNARMKNKSGN